MAQADSHDILEHRDEEAAARGATAQEQAITMGRA
jgi:hypothetical protein